MVKNPITLDAKATHRYDDIIELAYPLSTADTIAHPRMTIQDRAKIFAPFAALRGYEKAIAGKQKIVVPRMELAEESKEDLDRRLARMEQLLDQGAHPIVTVIYFEKDKRSGVDGGEYLQFTGMAARFEKTSRILQVVEKRLRLEDIYGLTGEDLEEV